MMQTNFHECFCLYLTIWHPVEHETEVCIWRCWESQFMRWWLFFVLGSQESRSILRRLDRVIGFPEEGALMLRDFEHALFGGTTVKQLLQGLVKNLAKRKGQHQRRKEQNTVLHFHRIVAHFYLVSSKINQCWYKIKLYYWKYWRTNFFLLN